MIPIVMDPALAAFSWMVVPICAALLVFMVARYLEDRKK